MRIATYNVEWFTELFDRKGRLLDDFAWSGRTDIRRDDQIAALGHVFQTLDADLIAIIEAPDQNQKRSTVQALENFSAHFQIRASTALMGFGNDTQQEIAVLFDPTKVTLRHDPKGEEFGVLGSHGAPRFDGVFHTDFDGDARADAVRFSKPPLEISAETPDGTQFHLIAAHLKSKAPHGARNAKQAARISITNGRKQLAQAAWLRKRVDEHLSADTPLILLGDLNDGPGLDAYENLFGRSSVEVVMGVDHPSPRDRLYDPHAMMGLETKLGAMPTTARFYLADQKRYLQALLDYIMVSSDLLAKCPKWKIWHPFDTPECYNDPKLRDALLVASDHFPVTLDIAL